MIAKAGILIALLSGDGYWFGGSTETVVFQWVVLHGAPDVRLDWNITAGRVEVAKGKVNLLGREPRGAASVPVPNVRVATEMMFHYRAVEVGNKRLIDEGQSLVHVYPRDILDSAAVRLHNREIYVWDEPAGLPATLKAAKIAHTSFEDPERLQFVRPDILIVAAGQVDRRPAGQAKLLNLAAAGSSVLVLRQTNMSSLAGYRLAPRKLPEKLAMLDGHPLLAHLAQWKIPAAEPAWALQLPVDEPVLPIAWWPKEYPAQPAAAVDALLASKALGRGRIVFCQYPLGSWQSDPRSQLFLDDALDYLMSPVGPTAPLAADR